MKKLIACLLLVSLFLVGCGGDTPKGSAKPTTAAPGSGK